MKKFFLLFVLMLTIVVSVNAQPRPRPHAKPSLRGLWILENNQGSEQFAAFTDSTYVLADASYSGGYSFVGGKYSIKNGKIFMTVDGASEPTVLDFMWMGPRMRMSNEKIILVYRRAHPGEIFPKKE